MKRNEKTEAQRAMAPQADGYTTTQFGRPDLRKAAQTDRGHARMSPSEFRTHRLGRRGQTEETARAAHDERTRYPRTTTRKV